MEFSLDLARAVLARTPAVLSALLGDLPPDWTAPNEGPNTWSPFDVVGHLIHGERTDWIPRVEHLLAKGESEPFPPFDRFAQFAASRGKSLGELLDRFAELRAQNLAHLEALELRPADLDRTGRHPEFGGVTLRQLLATWVAHDLDHIMQIVRVMAKQYGEEVGPWRKYLRIIGSDPRP